jgi:DNA polymerase I-like protein with 3'-5' exonuclease and polymerase domains
LGQFWQLVNGGDPNAAESDIDHKVIYKERELKAIVDQILLDRELEQNPIAMDAEWHGDYHTEEGQYLRTIQFSNREKWARCVVLRHQGGAPAFKPSIGAAIKQLRRLIGNDPVTGEPLPWDEDTDRIIGSSGMRGGEPCRVTRAKVGGHFFRADTPRLLSEGLDVRKQYEPHKTDPRRGGFDTALKYHAVNEATRYKLEDVGMRLTTVPRYDAKLQEWKKTFCLQHKLKAEDLDGYGDCPGEILYPYGNYDADVTWRINDKLSKPGGLLDSDAYGNECWTAYHLHHRASMPFYEMEQVGFMVDRDRVDLLTKLFMETQARLLNELREELNWPDFNPKSNIQVVAALFGDAYARKRDKSDGSFLSIRPEGARCLGLTPLTTTGKRPKLWAKVLARGEAEFHTPSTNKEVLGILGHKNPTARKLRDFKFIAQAMQSTLRAPMTDEESGQFLTDDNDNYEYEKGVAGLMHRDGIIRTHLFQTLETGRLASRRPNLQNFSKRREDDYKRIIGKDRHKHPIRSMLMVPPGYVGIEADLVGAELAVLAWLSQDANMIDHVRRSMLPEKDPDHYDIHSQQAVKAFDLRDVVPTKSGMKAAGCPGLRVAAKNVNFGIPYGRSAEAISRQCAEEGVDVDEAGCQLMIDAYFEQYPGTAVFLEECRIRSQDPHWLCGNYKSYRRFVPTNDRGVQGEQHRQAQNFPIQNGVADNVSIGLANLWDYRKTLNPDELWYHFVLQIHDAVILMCKVEHAKAVYDVVLQKNMVAEAPFWPHRLDGTPIQVPEPYHFGIDREIFIHWGEAITEEEAEKYNLPEWMMAH